MNAALLSLVLLTPAADPDAGRPARRGRRQAAQPRLRDRHPQGLDRRGRRLRRPADQGRHRRPAPRRHEEPAPGRVLDRRLREARRQADRARSRQRRRSRSRTRGRASSSAAGRTPTTCVELVAQGHRRGLPPRRRRRARRTCAASSSICKPHQGKEIFIRVVDKHTGHWGHVNFDDFRFHADKPNVQAPAESAGRCSRTTYQERRPAAGEGGRGDDRARKASRSRSSPASRTSSSRSRSASTTAAGSGSPRRSLSEAAPLPAAAAGATRGKATAS